MTNATKFWGAQYPDVATCVTNYRALAGTGTCDGDGNGRIDNSYEHYRAFQQMASAGIIEGTYNGMGNNGVSQGTYAGSNIMATKRSNVGVDVQYLISSGGNFVAITPANYIYLGGSTWNYDEPANGAVGPEDAWNIDTKIDDGDPTTGRVFERFSYAFNAQCLNATSTMYNLTLGNSYSTSSLAGCQLIFKID